MWIEGGYQSQGNKPGSIDKGLRHRPQSTAAHTAAEKHRVALAAGIPPQRAGDSSLESFPESRWKPRAAALWPLLCIHHREYELRLNTFS